MIRLEHVTKRYEGGQAPAVEDLSMVIPRGELVVLVGPSGCGKTTILKMINRVIEPSSGTIYLDGAETSTFAPHVLRRSIGYVIQRVGLFPHRTIADNIGTVPTLLGWDDDRIRRRVEELVALMGLDSELLDRYPQALSGGQQQRAGVARALAADPPVLLMDEPFGAVDPVVRTRLQGELLDLQQRLHKTIVLVTHDIDEALRLGDRIAVFSEVGRIEQFASPEELLARPASPYVDEFLGAHRTLRRAGLLRLDAILCRKAMPADAVQPYQDDAGLPRLASSATVRDALDVLLAGKHQAVIVTSGDVTVHVAFDDLRAALE
ncbi:MAG: ATP-binding cassette domain-containing protein [Nitriliruptoraceae bacterium]